MYKLGEPIKYSCSIVKIPSVEVQTEWFMNLRKTPSRRQPEPKVMKKELLCWVLVN